MNKSILNKNIGYFIFFIFLTIITLIGYSFDFHFFIEKIIYDSRFKLRGKIEHSNNIVILAIDEDSLKALGRWPWDRKILAKTIKNLFNYGAKVVGVDIIFAEKSNNISDSLLKEALSKGNSVIASYIEKIPRHSEIIENKLVVIEAQEKLIPPIDTLKSAALSGYTNVYPDNDGTLRKSNITKKVNGIIFKSFDLLIKELYEPKRKDSYPQNIYINYYGPFKTFTTYSFYQVYQNILPPAWFKDKIVLIGSTAVATFDHYPTPMQETFPGVEVHANIIENLINKTFLKKTNKLAFLGLIILFGCLSFFLFNKFHPILTTISVILFAILYYFITYFFFINYLYILDFTPIMFIIGSIGFANIINKVLIEQQKKKMIVDRFSRFFSPQVMQEILKDTEMLFLGGKKTNITVLFSDIRGFTQISEKLQPEEVVLLLNDYFETMTKLILKYNGTLDKYIGDAIMCFWNAPISQEDHTQKAVECAIEMISELQIFNRYLTQKNHNPISIGIGINCGPAVVGYVGSNKIMDYTAVGDTVNTASRLQDLTKEYSTQIIISDNVAKSIKNIALNSLGKINIRGKSKEIEIFNVIL